MKTKVENIMRHIAVHGKAIVKMDKASGVRQITITKNPGAYFTVAQGWTSELSRLVESDVIELLDINSIYIDSWS